MLRRMKITPAATVVILTVCSASRVSTAIRENTYYSIQLVVYTDLPERIVSTLPPAKNTKLMKMHTPAAVKEIIQFTHTVCELLTIPLSNPHPKE